MNIMEEFNIFWPLRTKKISFCPAFMENSNKRWKLADYWDDLFLCSNQQDKWLQTFYLILDKTDIKETEHVFHIFSQTLPFLDVKHPMHRLGYNLTKPLIFHMMRPGLAVSITLHQRYGAVIVTLFLILRSLNLKSKERSPIQIWICWAHILQFS